MSRILQSPSLFGQLISRSFGRVGFYSTKYSLSEAGGRLCESCEINGTRYTPVINKFRTGFLTPAIQSSKFHTTSSAHSEESEQEGQKGQVTERSSNEGGKENVIDRLRRLSETHVDDYELSPGAQEKANKMAEIRAEAIRKGEHWKWDQRNVRPGGFPQQNRNRYDRNNEDFDDYRGGGNQRGYNNNRGFDRYNRGDEDSYGGGRQQGYNNNRNRGFNRYDREEEEEFDSEDLADQQQRSWRDRPAQQRQQQYSQRRSREYDDDEPQDYEQEMEKLRARLEKTKLEKQRLVNKKASVASEETDSEERSTGASKSNNLHQIPPQPLQNYRQERSLGQVGSVSSARRESYHNQNQYEDEFPARRESFHNQNQYEDEFQRSPREDQLDLSAAAFDPDSFGTLTLGSTDIVVKDLVGAAIQKQLNEDAKDLSTVNEVEEEDDTRYIPPREERWTTPKLLKKVGELLTENRLKEAVDLFLGVLKEGGFDFDDKAFRHQFHVLIHECAKVGYVEMAFRLYNLMKKRGYKAKDRTISCLLNACANSPWDKENNLDRIEKLLISDKERGYELNQICYSALIKAYGRLGETVLAFNVVDQMINESKLTPDTSVFNMLLQACITDTKNGFRHALVTWNKMQSMGRRPDIYSFNLLLRTVKDCGIEVKNIEVEELKSEKRINAAAATSVPLLPPIVTEEDSNRMLSFLCLENPSSEETQLVLDNLGDPSIISAKKLTKALSLSENRLAMLGGLRGIVSKMARSKVAPNLKTLTELMSVTHPSEFIDIMRLLRDSKIKPDASFFTVAIARCNLYDMHAIAKEMLKQMPLYNVSPNIVTWGALSLGCTNWKQAKELLEEMEEAKFTPNIEVMYSLLYAATRNFDPKYVLNVMEGTRLRNMALHQKYLIVLEKFRETTQRGLVSKEMGKPVEPKKLNEALERNAELPEHFALFKMRYPVWLKSVDIKVVPENPWKNEFEKFRQYGRHSTPAEEAKEGDDIMLEPTKVNVSSKNQ
ncbi:unnamed protein product [Orchesella dallaii]|uniref:PROP1-like PPR domain-containing protein n=1 Tax=Orchesella dallaii TaxID=48710 RepID=A0ABP1QQD2_9HEXA